MVLLVPGKRSLPAVLSLLEKTLYQLHALIKFVKNEVKHTCKGKKYT